MVSKHRFPALLLVTSILTVFAAHGAEPESLFNGRELTGWKGLPDYWTVQDGAIVGETTKEKAIDGNTFLIWQGGDVDNFEFTASVRFRGNNTGVQYRSQLFDEKQMALMGYQLDLHPSKAFFGMLYGEKYGNRGKIATRGQKVEIDAAGTVKQLGKVGSDESFTDWDWNEIRIVAVGDRLIHQVNGITTIDVTDRDKSALAKGLLGLQLHKGPPMRVEFKDLKLRRLNAEEGMALIETFAAAPVAPKQTPAQEPAIPSKAAGKRKNAPKAKAKTNEAKTDRRGVNPDNQGLSVANGFQVEVVHNVDAATQGSWVALTIDDKGRMIASDQGGKGLFRITVGSSGASVEKLPVELSGAQGLQWKAGCLYASISGEGVYRVTDTKGDDRFDHAELLSSYFGKGEHGNHGLVDTEDSNQIYAVSGNQTPLPDSETIARRRVQSWQEDLLLPRLWDPRGHARGIMAPGGWITRFDPATKTHDVYCVGFRNEYDLALNAYGDVFTYDADMEWDLGLPWYRPTRICQVVSGGDYGWRGGSGKWRPYFEDSLPPLVEIGPGSPTGVISGRGTRFPVKYQQAIFALDWTYGRILAIHLQPDGAGYKAAAEDFVVGPALPVTDAVVGADGALYFTTGGRGAKSDLMRIIYTGGQSTAPYKPKPLPAAAVIRRELEAFHGVANPAAIASAWPHLSSSDRFLRNAARVAIESQPVETWAANVFSETSTQARITAAVALARMGSAEHSAPLLDCLFELDLAKLPLSQQLGLLRAYQLTLERLGKPADEQREVLIAKLNSQLPAAEANVNAELLRLLVYLNASTAVAKGMQLIEANKTAPAVTWGGVEKLNPRYGGTLKKLSENPPPTHAIDFACMLRNMRTGWTPELRRQYFTFLNLAAKASGGACYPLYLANIRDEALATCTNAERIALKDLTGEDFNPVPDFVIEPPVGPGQEWTMPDALEASSDLARANFERGRSLFYSANCGTCHRFVGLGGGVGPDLTSVPNKFDSKYLIEAIINPSKNISDQYQSSIVLLQDGRVLSGLVVEKDDQSILVYPPDPKAEAQVVLRDQIEAMKPSAVSQMPTGLLNKMNENELRDLVAYIMSGGNPDHKTYKGRGKKK